MAKIVGVIFLILLYFYIKNIDLVPVHLNQDELMFSLNSYSIAKNGTDYYGNLTPFYFWHLNELWATPVIVYLTSIFLKFLPISETSIRLSSVFIGLMSAGLTVLIVKKIFKNRALSLTAGLLFLTTPVVFIHSRLLLDNFYPVAFTLLWILFLIKFQEKEKPLFLFLAGITLGMGIHSYHAAKIMMPIYFGATVIYFSPQIRKSKVNLVALFSGFLIPILLFIPWLKAHPDTLFNQVEYVTSLDKTAVSFGANKILNTAKSYISYFDPQFLFFTGDRTLVHSTGAAGVFLVGGAILIIFGILEIVFNQKSKISKLILFGFLTYPIAPSFINDPQRISRGLVVVPFAILIFIYGIIFFQKQKEKSFRFLLTGIYSLLAVQFAVFLSDYFGQYPKRSYSVFNNNIVGAIDSAIKSTEIRNVENIYIDKYIPFYKEYFEFAKLKNNKTNLTATQYDYKSDDFTKFQSRSIVILSSVSYPVGKPDRLNGFEKIEIIREPDGNEAFLIYYKDK